MKEIYLVDFIKETKKIFSNFNHACDGMTDNEIKAYNFGVENILYALELFVETEKENCLYVYDKNVKCISEITLEEFNKIVKKGD